MLIGNLTRDPELRYTPQGTAVVTFGLATNRTWTTESGEKREETEFHRIVAWNKLAELCAQLLFKGRRVFVEGRLSTRRFVGSDNQEHQVTEIVIDDMLLLDSRRLGTEEPYVAGSPTAAAPIATEEPTAPVEEAPGEATQPPAPAQDDAVSKTTTTKGKKSPKRPSDAPEKEKEEEVPLKPEDIPF